MYYIVIQFLSGAKGIVGAMQWYDEIGAALRRCDWFAVILSPRAVDSMWVERELRFALRQRRFDRKILPLLYQSCDVDQFSWTLLSVQMIDFTGDFTMPVARFSVRGD